MNSRQVEKEKQCSLCYPASQQIVQMMFNLAKDICKQHQSFAVDNKIGFTDYQQKNIENDDGGVDRLIKFLFHNTLGAACICKHQIVHQFLEIKTKMTKNQLNFACQTIYTFHAKRNFQLEVLTNQIKCFPKTISEEMRRTFRQNLTILSNSQPSIKVESNKNFDKEDIPEITSQKLAAAPIVGTPLFPPYYFYRIQPFSIGSFCAPFN